MDHISEHDIYTHDIHMYVKLPVIHHMFRHMCLITKGIIEIFQVVKFQEIFPHSNRHYNPLPFIKM